MGTFTWTGSNGSSWLDAGNWTPGGGPPGGGDDATLLADGEFVDIGGNAAVNVLTLGFAPFDNIPPAVTVHAGFTFSINGGGSSIDNGSIVVQPGADMDWAFNGDFSNQGTITIGSATTNAAVTQGGLGINGAVTLDGHGTLNLGLDNPL